MAPDARSFSREAGLVFAGRLFRLAVVFFSQVVVARKLGLAAYGEFAFVLALAQLVAGGAIQGVATATLRYVPAYEAAGERGLLRGFLRWSDGGTLGAGLLLAGLGALALPFVPVEPSLRRALEIGCLLLPPTALLNLYGARLQTRRSALADLPEGVLRPLLGLAIFAAGGQATSAAALSAFGLGAAGALLAAAALARRSGLDAPPERRRGEWLRASGEFFLASSGALVLSRAGVPLVGAVLGADAAGPYAAAERIALVMAFALASGQTRLAPLIPERHAAGDAAGLRSLVAAGARLTSAAAAVAFIGIAAAGPFALSLFGPDFAAARAPLLILAGGQLAVALTGPAAPLLSMTGHGRDVARVLGGAAAVHLLLAWILTSRWGALGAAVSTAATLAAAHALLALRARSRVGVRTPPF